jgi:two-component system chemotaxis response regulator CheB
MKKIRVLVIEDSQTVRKHLVEALGAAPGFEVVGEAADGQQGIDLCLALRPDVVTLDMILPLLNGLQVTEHLMAYCPTPILIVSSSTNRGELFQTYQALAAGALDVLDKPRGDEPAGDWSERFVSTLKVLARIKVITHPRARLDTRVATLSGRRARAQGSPPSLAAPGDAATPPSASQRPARVGGLRAIAIGVSTGGPAALVALLQGLPEDFALPILLVIHLGPLFAPAFGEWLSEQSPLPVAYAQDGALLPRPGHPQVLIAPPDRHLELRAGRLLLTQGPALHSCRPSVDVLFTSLAAELGPRCAAGLLTGMGKDGARGLLAIRRAGGRTLAQDEATSVVFGMPMEAIRLGAAERVLPLDQIAPALGALARGEAGGLS